jgi:hypothetical protein
MDRAGNRAAVEVRTGGASRGIDLGPPPIPDSLWNTVPPDAQAAILAVWDSDQQRIADLERHVRDLEARLRLNPTNSSKASFVRSHFHGDPGTEQRHDISWAQIGGRLDLGSIASACNQAAYGDSMGGVGHDDLIPWAKEKISRFTT